MGQLAIIAGLAGIALIPVFLVCFAVASRGDALQVAAIGRDAQWARRMVGAAVTRGSRAT